ncbi:threonine--tRNA ligase, partial [Buchnera aphidicola (Hormaphis cornu)]
CHVSIITINDDKNLALKMIRSSCMQLFSYAIKELWPESKIAGNQISDEGFSYDVDVSNKLKQRDLYVIEKKMQEIAYRNYDILKKEISVQEAKLTFQKLSEPYKFLLFNNDKFNNKKKISLYYHENHVDYTEELQLPNIRFCRYFKIQSISGVYWLGDVHNKMLQRVYVIVWATNKHLQLYFSRIKELEKRDHRLVGKKLDLYHIQEESPGMVFWHHNGWIIFKELETFIREKLKIFNYQEVKSPTILDQIIWKKSGHWENYKESIFTTISEKHQYCLKPMNCPAHIQIYNQKLRSYKELPMRIAEFGSCHRNESSGSLHGLMRIRAFTQDDAHIFCTTNQIRSEVHHCIKMIYDIYNIFGFQEIKVKFSSRPKKRIGDDTTWDYAEKDLIRVLQENNLPFEYQAGEGAFYGPKIEFLLLDSLNRMWQCGTIQLDFYLPKRLNAFYINEDNDRIVPVMIHRAILGSIERFLGILIEEYSGSFPLWLAPYQVLIVSISKTQSSYVTSLKNRILDSGLRVEIDIRNVTIGLKVKDFISKKIPYMLICGDSEVARNVVTIRTRSGKIFKHYNIDYFIAILLKDNKNRSINELEE